MRTTVNGYRTLVNAFLIGVVMIPPAWLSAQGGTGARASQPQGWAVRASLNNPSGRLYNNAKQKLLDGKARYVDVAVIAPIHPKRHKTPLLIAGPYAGGVAPLLEEMEMKLKVVSGETGKAAAIKMIRSVMIKGLEALVIESYATARAYGVEDHVLPTLQETFPSIDWSQQGAYFFSRVVQHGKRRAEEMREAANTVKEAGFDPQLTAAIAAKQQWVADEAAAGAFTAIGKGAPWQDYADALLARRSAKGS